MGNSKFQEYYQEVKERDEKLANNRQLPYTEGTNVWTVFGLSLGIASIIFSFFTKYSFVLAVIALVFSFVGYRQKKNGVATAGLICSTVGFITSITLAVYRYLILTAIYEIIIDYFGK